MTIRKKPVRASRKVARVKPLKTLRVKRGSAPKVETPLAERCQQLMAAAGYRNIQAMADRGEQLGFTPSPRKGASSLYASFHSLGSGFRNIKLGVLFRWWVVLKNGDAPPADTVFQELLALWCEQQISVGRRKAKQEGLEVPAMDKFGFYGRLEALAEPQAQDEKNLLSNYRLLKETNKKIVQEYAGLDNESESWTWACLALRIKPEGAAALEVAARD